MEKGAVSIKQIMAEEQPTFKIVDRRPFNPDGTPRELSAEEREEAERAEKAAAVQEAAVKAATAEAAAKTTAKATSTAAQSEVKARPKATPRPSTPPAGDPMDDPASFLSLIMSLASNAAASLGMMPHPVTGETGVELKTAKHWIDVLGMLEKKTEGNLNDQEAQVIEGLLADLRMQYVSLTSSPTPPPARFSASDITGGK